MDNWMTTLGAVLLLIVAWGVANSRGWRARRLWERAIHAVNAEDWNKAEKLFRKCVRLVPVWTGARKMYAVALLRQQRLDEAEEQFRMASNLEPRKPESHLDLGFFLATQRPDRQEEAIESFARAVAYDPQVREVLRKEERLALLKDNPRFIELLHEPREADAS